MIGLPIINPEVVSNERGEAMSLHFTARQFQELPRREFYRLALRAILASGTAAPEYEERLILQLRREESAFRA